MDEKFSVLMTTYHGEKPEFLALSLNSVLVEQTRLPDQFVLLVDGPIPEELDEVIKRYANDFPEIMQVIYSPVNQGQSKASAEGLKYVKYDLVARMDSDDICRPYRFEKELEVFSRDPNIGVVGGWISEFDQVPDDAITLRTVPETDEQITHEFRKRTPINNMTVMMRKSQIERAGGYGRETVNEDYSLYAHMWAEGTRFYNIQEVLVDARVGNGMVARRHDFRIYKDWRKDQKFLVKCGKHSRFTAFISNFRCFCFVITPIWVKKILYKRVLRKKVKENKKIENQ